MTMTANLPTDEECRAIHEFFGDWFGIETTLLQASSDGSLGLNPIRDYDAEAIEACSQVRDLVGRNLVSKSRDTPGHYHVNPYGMAYLRWYRRLGGKSETW